MAAKVDPDALQYVYFTLAGAACGFIPRYFAKKLNTPEIGIICVFVCAIAGYAGGLAIMIPVAALLTLALWWFQVRIPGPDEVGAKGLQLAKKHPVLAVFFDLHIVGSLFPVLLVLSITLVPEFWMLILVVVIGICLSFYVFMYPRFPSFRATFCTPGECMAGCFLENSSRVWYSPFTQSRWLLFLTLFILLLYPRNAFDSVIEQAVHGNPPSFLLVLSRSIYVIVFLTSIYRIAQGEFGWSIVPYIFLSLQLLFIHPLNDLLPIQVIKGLDIFSISLLTIALAHCSHTRALDIKLWPENFGKFLTVVGACGLVFALVISSGTMAKIYLSRLFGRSQGINYSSPDGDFIIEFPAPPTERVLPTGRNALGEGELYIVSVQFKSITFIVHRLTYPAKVESLGDVDRIFKWISPRSPVSEQPVQLGELQGVEYVTRSNYDKLWVRTRAFYSGRRIYKVATRSYTRHMSSAEQQFFNSFQMNTDPTISDTIERNVVKAQNWISFVSPEGDFTVEFPAAPNKKVSSLSHNTLGNGDSYHWGLDYGGVIFYTNRSMYSEEIEKLGDPEYIKEWIKDPDWIKKNNQSVMSERPIQLGEIQGIEYVTHNENDKWWYKNRIFYFDKRIYTISTVSSNREMRLDEQRFFNSFRIHKENILFNVNNSFDTGEN